MSGELPKPDLHRW